MHPHFASLLPYLSTNVPWYPSKIVHAMNVSLEKMTRENKGDTVWWNTGNHNWRVNQEDRFQCVECRVIHFADTLPGLIRVELNGAPIEKRVNTVYQRFKMSPTMFLPTKLVIDDTVLEGPELQRVYKVLHDPGLEMVNRYCAMHKKMTLDLLSGVLHKDILHYILGDYLEKGRENSLSFL
jgi:hypothetical protein